MCYVFCQLLCLSVRCMCAVVEIKCIIQFKLRFLKCACIAIGARRIDVDMCLSPERLVII